MTKYAKTPIKMTPPHRVDKNGLALYGHNKMGATISILRLNIAKVNWKFLGGYNGKGRMGGHNGAGLAWWNVVGGVAWNGV